MSAGEKERELIERLFGRYKGRPLVVRIEPDRIDREIIKRIARAAAEGALVVYPTDTVYGLGTTPLRGDAVKRVFEAKERPINRPLPVLVSSIEAAEKLVEFTREARRLAERFWPGGLTIVLRAKPGLPRELHAGTGKLGVRMPRHPVALALIEEAGGALVGTSANLHGKPSPRTALEALEQLGERVDIVIDSGPAPGGVPSTVVDLTTEPPRLLREGAVPASVVEKFLGKKLAQG